MVGGAFARIGLEFVSHVPGIVAGMLFVSAPILVSGAREAFRGVDPRLERVARTLGDSPAASFRRVTLPLAGRGILAAAILAWARCVSEFGAIVILTYNPQVASVLIYDRFTTLGLPAAVPAALLLLAVALGVFGLVRLLQPAERRMIRLDGLTVQVGSFTLRDISFEVPTGGYGLVIGPSGSGKTTLLEAVAGHTRPSAGAVHLHGTDITGLPPNDGGSGSSISAITSFRISVCARTSGTDWSRGRSPRRNSRTGSGNSPRCSASSRCWIARSIN